MGRCLLPLTLRYRPGDGPSHKCNREVRTEWSLHSSSRYVWLALTRPPWSPTSHGAFPAALRDAARALLLAAHRNTEAAVAAGGLKCPADEQQAAAAGLAALPSPLLLHILCMAAYTRCQLGLRWEALRPELLEHCRASVGTTAAGCSPGPALVCACQAAPPPMQRQKAQAQALVKYPAAATNLMILVHLSTL